MTDHETSPETLNKRQAARQEAIESMRNHFEAFGNRVWLTAENSGWHGDETFGDKVALIHSEVSEALEEFRNGVALHEIYYSYKDEDGNTIKTRDQYREVDGKKVLNKPEGPATEFADIIIRVFDTAGMFSMPVVEALFQKAAYNDTRPFRHGGKVI